ncbi:hypothetical protein [Arcanobacterium bovis]|uniref:hypothetical protein n=1 Tax=Arcanobacterium bovis TaxID=2529275 RepID=UPI001F4FD58B|nr:hypothetical protein [Arcanobacterium bovis]
MRIAQHTRFTVVFGDLPRDRGGSSPSTSDVESVSRRGIKGVRAGESVSLADAGGYAGGVDSDAAARASLRGVDGAYAGGYDGGTLAFVPSTAAPLTCWLFDPSWAKAERRIGAGGPVLTGGFGGIPDETARVLRGVAPEPTRRAPCAEGRRAFDLGSKEGGCFESSVIRDIPIYQYLKWTSFLLTYPFE